MLESVRGRAVKFADGDLAKDTCRASWPVGWVEEPTSNTEYNGDGRMGRVAFPGACCGRSPEYPSHSTPNLRHLKHTGLPSSHLTRLTLIHISNAVFHEEAWRLAYLHVIQPFLDLGLLALFLFLI